jgi:hypothetical protein
MGGHPIVSSDTTSLSDENQESGLWLWHGKAPLPQSPSRPASRVQQFLDPIVSALRRGGWIALPSGVAVALLAIMLRSMAPDKPVPADMPAMAQAPVPASADAPPLIPAPPVDIPAPSVDVPAPRVEDPDTQLDQAQMPAAPAALLPAQGAEHQLSKKRRRRSAHQREPSKSPTRSLTVAHHS